MEGGRGGARELEVTVISQTEQDRLELVCKVFRPEDSPLHLDISWHLPADNQQLHKDDLVMMMGERFSIDEVKLDSIIVSTLIVAEVDEDDQGVYKCVVETIDGKSVEAETFVNVDAVPSELITINPALDSHSERNPSNSGTKPRLLLSVFILIYGCLSTILNQ